MCLLKAQVFVDRIDLLTADAVNHQHLAPVSEIAVLVAIDDDGFGFFRGKAEAALSVLGGDFIDVDPATPALFIYPAPVQRLSS
jgi:hypothetical protein